MNPTPAHEGIAWRPAFALRVFTLALLTATLLREDPFAEWAFTAVMLGAVGLSASAVHLTASARTIGFVPVIEAMMCVVLLSASPGAGGLLPYLVVPPLAAGLTTGAVRCLSAGLVAFLALASAALSPGVPLTPGDAWAGVPWVSLGMVAGVIASRQTRAERAVNVRQEQALRGRRLLAEFGTTTRPTEALDFESQARSALDELLLHTKAFGGKIVLTDGVHARPLASTGNDPQALQLAMKCARTGSVVVLDGWLGVPLGGVSGVFGAVVLRSDASWARSERKEVEELARELAIPLDMALIFSQVTESATAAERSRLARDIHDTVAQDIASLGYLVDALAQSSAESVVHEQVAELRAEITRIVGELRYSIFDLRAGELSLGAAITAHARHAVERTGLKLHLDVEPLRLPGGQEQLARHLQRIAQEAVTNSVRHANAQHLWVRLHRVTDEMTAGLRLEIEDDGVGIPANGVATGFGLESMSERAEAMGAALEHLPGSTGGTMVRVEVWLPSTCKQST